MKYEYTGNNLAEGERILFPMYLPRLLEGDVLSTRWVMKWFVYHEGFLIMEE